MSKAQFTFASIQRPTVRYRIYYRGDDNPAYDWRRLNSCLSAEISQFDTMGDGETQHSPDCLVQTENCMDVIDSLANSLHLMSIDIDNAENCDSLALRWFWRGQSSISDKLIQFCLGVKYSEKKDTYFTLHEGGKVSSSETKRFDKRWSRVPSPDERDDAIDRVLRMVNTEGMNSSEKPCGLLQLIATMIRIAELSSDGTYDAQAWLKRGPGIFTESDHSKISAMLQHFQYITQFKDAVYLVRRTREWSQRSAENAVKRELQTAE